MPRVLSQAALLVAIPVLFSGCLDEQGQFVYQRVADQCDTPWPICDTIAGCILGDSSYISGQFPTTGQVIVSLQEPSTVTVSFFVEDVAGAGTQTNLYFFEEPLPVAHSPSRSTAVRLRGRSRAGRAS